MNILKFYDYVFYRLSSFFERNGGEDLDRSIAILSILQCLNLLTLIDLISILLVYSINLPHSIELLLGIILFFVFNSIRYRRFKTYQDLNKVWSNENESIRIKRGFYLILYFAFSVIITGIFGHLALSI